MAVDHIDFFFVPGYLCPVGLGNILLIFFAVCFLHLWHFRIVLDTLSPNCMSYFYHCYNKIPNRKNIREKRFKKGALSAVGSHGSVCSEEAVRDEC